MAKLSVASRWRSNQSSERLNPNPPQPALKLRATWDLGPGTLNLARDVAWGSPPSRCSSATSQKTVLGEGFLGS